jgi:hypothetical protein
MMCLFDFNKLSSRTGIALSNDASSYGEVSTGFPVLKTAEPQLDSLSFLSYGGFMAGWAASTTAPLR